MESGYINEGGQLKTKNGQKYVFNSRPSGIYISKTCATFTLIIALLILLFAILITYYVTISTTESDGCTNGHLISNSFTSPPHVQQQNVDQIQTASMLGIKIPNNEYNTKPSVGDILPDNDDESIKLTDHKLQLHEGWLPLHYMLVIEPNIKTSLNNGSVAILIERDKSMSQVLPIVLDVKNITISNVRLVRSVNASDDQDENALEFDGAYGANNDTFIVKLSKNVANMEDLKLILSMDFISQITDTLQGVYKISYNNTNNEEQEWMLSTQFSPIDARRAFPCFDRPDKKANFTISIIRSSRTSMALSNMPVMHSSTHRSGFIRDDFMTTPKMPTYLVAFIVSNLVKSQYSDIDSALVPRVEIWTRPEYKSMTKYAYYLVRKFLPFFEGYFGIENRLPKIDLVSIPDFGFGAMENWGLITFRDAALLVPEDLEKASSAEHMQYVAQIVAHELAHQWFGNLVTPKWWDDLWLKEGFACYMSYLAVNFVHPEYEIMDNFAVFEFKESMQHDSDKSSHSIAFEVKSTGDIRRIFDPITYSKSTILLRMLNSIIGNEAFRNATQDLLKSLSYGNADRDDLWRYMTKHGHLERTLPKNMTIKMIMDSWISKPGYPVIMVERRDADIIVTQERFMLPTRNDSDNSKWIVPITYETDELHKGDHIPTHWLMDNDHELIINDVFTSNNNSENVIYLNLDRQAYYRVNYDMVSWLALKKKFTTLPRITRAQLMDDALHLAQAEYLTYDIPLTFLLELFTSTDDEFLWSAAQKGLTYLTHMLCREPAYETFRAFMKFIVRPAYDRYGLEEPDNESHIQLQHRALVARLACKFKYDRCFNAAHIKYRQWMDKPRSNFITPNMKPIIYCTALAEGSYQEWYFAYEQYNSTTSASEKEQILQSLGCTTKPWLLSKYLNMTINATSGILKQDGNRAFKAVAENPIGFEIAFDFLETNIKEIYEYYGDGFSTLTSMINSITTYMNKEYHKQQLERFKEKAQKLELKTVVTAIELAMAQVSNNIYWRQRSYFSLKDYLEAIVSEFGISVF